MQANTLWQRPQTGGEDQFFTQCATDIHKIRPQKREGGRTEKGGGRKGNSRDGDKENSEWVSQREKFGGKKGCPGRRVSGRQSERKGGRRLGSSFSGR